MTQTRGDLLVLGAALIWGVAFYFQKTAMYHIGPLLFLGLRALIGAIALAPFAVREHQQSETEFRSVLPIALCGGLVFFTAAAIQQFGIVTTTVINTGFLTALYVVATPFLYWLIERKRPTLNVWIAVVIAFSGVVALEGGTLLAMSRGDALVALAAIFWGLHMVVVGYSGRLRRPLTYTCMSFSFVACLSLSLAVSFEPIEFNSIVDALDSILYVGLLSSALTFGMMAVALQYIPAPRATVLLSVEVLFSAMAGYFFLQERLDLLAWVGGSLIVAAILIVRFKDSE